ncbi:DNA N-6-adenine-methyltransferase [Shinella sp.]|jgi:hypothetical protein|uniref:DNA N-6-adenine-methyltransferase n=1 Tax=Shinella sp. TaxID=1870904 RepID=UPI003F7103FE
MSHWEASGKSDDWWTPKYIFDALGETFDLDVSAPFEGPLHVPCLGWLYDRGLERAWNGFVWMNPPFGGRNGIWPWLKKFYAHGDGIALVPDRTSAPWWQDGANVSDGILLVAGKVKFIRPDRSLGKSPSTGTTLIAAGRRGVAALQRAEQAGLGLFFPRVSITTSGRGSES